MKEGGSEKGGGGKFTHFTSPGPAPAPFMCKDEAEYFSNAEKPWLLSGVGETKSFLPQQQHQNPEIPVV